MIKAMARRMVALLLVLMVMGAGAWRVGAFAPDWEEPAFAGFDSVMGDGGQETPTRDNLCEGGGIGTAIPIEKDPSWVPVSGVSNPRDPDRAFVEAHGQVFYGPNTPEANGRGNPFVHETDINKNHWNHDINIMLTPDRDSNGLLAGGNFNDSEYAANEVANLELEWENTAAPQFAWPTPGDRMTVWGNLIWDCGHGGPDMYRTEIHPPVGWVTYRQTASKTDTPQQVPENNNVWKNTENPWRWYESTDLQGIGATLPLVGPNNTPSPLGNTPVQATVADAVFSSYGGKVMANLNGCNDDGINSDPSDPPGAVNATCWNYFPNANPNPYKWIDEVLQQDYTFFVPAPPKPQDAPNAAMLWQAEDHCADLSESPGQPFKQGNYDFEGVNATLAEGAGTSAYNIGKATCNIPDKVQETVQNGQPGIKVTVLAHKGKNGVVPTYPANSYVGYAKRFKVAWDYLPDLLSQRAHTYKTDFQWLVVRNNNDFPCDLDDAAWVMALRFNENSVYPVDGQGDGGKPFWQNDAVDDGRVCVGSDGPPAKYWIGITLTASALPDQALNLWDWGSDRDVVNNDILPAANYDNPHSDLGTGTLGPQWLDINVDGSHNIIYTISDVTPPMPPDGALTIGSPHYGPQPPYTGGLFENRTRVTSKTPMYVDNPGNAMSLEFRYWADGAAPQENWKVVTGPQLMLTFDPNTPDGNYIFEYATISNKGIVGKRQRVNVQLDNTPPTLTVADVHAAATSANDATVTWSLPAVPTDNFPGPITTACDHPTTLQVLISHPVKVTCTATDAVQNTTTKSFVIIVDPPFGYVRDFMFLGQNWVRLGARGTAIGHVGAVQSSNAAPLTAGGRSGVEVQIGDGTQLLPKPDLPNAVAGEDIQLGDQTKVGNVFPLPGSSHLVAGQGAVYTLKPGFVPLFPGLPSLPQASAGNWNVNFTANTTLMALTYGDVTIAPGVQVIVPPGDYAFKSLTLQTGSLGSAQLIFSGPATIHITDRLAIGDSASVAPKAGSGVTAHQVIFYIGGADAVNSRGVKVPAVKIGNLVQINANIYAPNGTLTIGTDAKLVGAFIGQAVDVGDRFAAMLDSALDIVYP